jgi:sugar phosphate permease
MLCLSHPEFLTWRRLYIIEGAITIFVGIIVTFVLPDFPHTWKLLSPEMKAVANRRMALDASEADVDTGGGMSQLQGLKEAFKDPKTYILALAYHAITGAAGKLTNQMVVNGLVLTELKVSR